MNTDTVNRWLTLSANIGVVIGLILLLIEINQNNRLLRAQIHQARSDAHVDQRVARADSEHLLAAWEKFVSAGGPEDFAAMDELTPMEVARVKEYMVARHQDYDNLFYQYQNGFLDEEYYQHRIVFPIKAYAPWWKKLGVFESGGRRPSFEAEINRIVGSAN